MLKKILLIIGLVGLLAGTAWAATEMMSVQVKKAQLRAKPQFMSKVLVSYDYGDRVRVTGEQGPWRSAAGPDGKEGWLHVSALSAKKIVLSSGRSRASVSASREEMTLAGKGFNEAVEKAYRSAHSSAGYKAVDQVEKTYNPGRAEMIAFIETGLLRASNKAEPMKPAEAKVEEKAPTVRSGGGNDEAR